MDYRVLGPFEVLADGRAVALGGPRQRALLAALVLAPGRSVPVARLIDGIWGEDVPDSAAKMVQVYVSQLRKALPAGLLATRPPGYQLQAGLDEVDALRADRLLREARAARAAGDERSAALALEDALALWRGPALAEFPEPFAASEARRLEELRLSVLEERFDVRIALGGQADVLGELERLVADEPLRERLRGLLMLALYRSGRQAEALAAYQDLRERLAGELGIDPSPELRDLQRRILRQDPGLEPPADARSRGAQAPAGRADPGAGAVLGRADELAAARSCLARATAGGAVLLVSGEPGIGKSRLCDELVAGARRAGWTVLVGAAEEDEAGRPYAPLRRPLRRLVADRPGLLEELDPAARSEVASLLDDDDGALGAGGGRRACPSPSAPC